MTTPANRPNTALLVIDVQNGVVAGAHARDEVVANIRGLIERARAERVPVVWVQHSDDGLEYGSDDWRIVPELRRDDGEPLVEKTYGDSFEATDLEERLSALGVGRLIVTGAQTAWGAPPPEQVIAHTNLYWSGQTAPGRTAGTVPTADVDFAS